MMFLSADLSFEQSDESTVVNKIVLVFIYLGRNHHFAVCGFRLNKPSKRTINFEFRLTRSLVEDGLVAWMRAIRMGGPKLY
jgi:hypothetical protein